MKWVYTILVMLFLLGIGEEASAKPPVITAIRFVGNRVTRPQVMLQEMSIHVGDPVNPEAIEASRQAIMDLGLFRSVNTELVDVPEGKELVITVVEKFYILPLPRIDARPDGNYNYGAEIRFDNLAGLNQQLKLVYLNKDTINGNSDLSREASVNYGYPRIFGTANNFGFNASIQRQDLDVTDEALNETGHYRYEARSYGFGLSRWLKRESSRGWRIGGGLSREEHDYKYLSGTPDLASNGALVSLNGQWGFFGVHDYGTYRSGEEYGLSSSLGVPQLGSDESYSDNLFFYRRYDLLGPAVNLNWQAQLGLSNGTRFGAPAYSLGGASSLRGYSSSTVEGNALALLNVQYLHPLFGLNAFRGVLFSDVGNVYPGVMEMDFTNLRASVGFGFRWTVTLFVNVSVRADLAYGFGSREVRTYVGTSRVF